MYFTETIPLLMLYWHHGYRTQNDPGELPSLEEKYKVSLLEYPFSVTQKSHRYLGTVRGFRFVGEALLRWSLTTPCSLLPLPPLPPWRPAMLSYHNSLVSLAVSYLHYFVHTVTFTCIPVS